MKRIIIKILILCIILTFITGTFFMIKINLFDSQSVSRKFEDTMQDEQVYYNLFITMVYPYVEKAVDDYYSEYIAYPLNIAPYDYEFINIERINGLNYSYIVQLVIYPYVGPHLSVGKDRITFVINLDGVTLKEFKHIRSYDLPPHYQHIIKQKLPD